MNGKARRSLPAVAVILLGLAPVIANAQNGGADSLESQLAAKYKVAKVGQDSTGISVTDPGTVLVIKKGGILSVASTNMVVIPSYVKDGQVIDIEGNPDSPINHGTLCPKGSATFQYTVNPSRLMQVLYRAPYSDHWEVKSVEWAMEQIAQRVKKTRDETFVERLPDGREVNHTLGIASLGGATLDVEENYLIKKLFSGGLGIVSIENQARI